MFVHSFRKGKQATSKKLVFQELPVPAAVYSDSENSVEDDDVREPSAFKPRKLTNRDFLSSFIGRFLCFPLIIIVLLLKL